MAMPSDPQGVIEKAMVAGVPVEFRDRRDWDEIRAWAAGIAAVLRGAGEQEDGEETEAGRERT